MSNQEILEKAIQKAVDNGWQYQYDGTTEPLNRENALKLYKLFIFNHDFARALWGETPDPSHLEVYLVNGGGKVPSYTMVDQKKEFAKRHSGWQYHLQQMVIADDPIKYLGDNI